MIADPARPTVLSVGRLYCDLIFADTPRMPSLGTEVYAGGLSLHAGGGAFITAAYFAALGHGSALASFLPAPPFRDTVADEIAAAGVDLSLSRPAPGGADPQITLAMVSGGDRAFLTRRAGPPMPALSAADLRALGAQHLHIGELATLVECPDLPRAAQAAGATVSLDCAWDETMTAAALEGLLTGIDVFLPNETEAQHLGALGLARPWAPLTVVKRGAAGATLWSDGPDLSAPAMPVAAVDTTGAGDAFNAGFLSAWLGGQPLAECLASGNRMGARAISGRGGFQRAPEAKAAALAR